MISAYNLETQTIHACREDSEFPVDVKSVPTYTVLHRCWWPELSGIIVQCQWNRVRDDTKEQPDFEQKIIGIWRAWHWGPSGMSSCWRARCSTELWGKEWVQWWRKRDHGSLRDCGEVWVGRWCHLSQMMRDVSFSHSQRRNLERRVSQAYAYICFSEVLHHFMIVTSFQ